MQKITTLKQAKALLEAGNVLVFKPRLQPLTFLTASKEDRIVRISSHLRYRISYSELEEILREETVWLYEKDEVGEINPNERRYIQ